MRGSLSPQEEAVTTVCICVYKHVYMPARVFTCVTTCVCMCTHRIHTCMYAHTHTLTVFGYISSVFVYVYICVHMHL